MSHLDGCTPPEGDEISQTMTAMEDAAKELCARTGRSVSLAAVMSILAKYPCPARCFHGLSHQERGTIDPFYSERHRYLQRLLVDRLRVGLADAGIKVRLVAEHAIRVGRGDVDVIATRSGVELKSLGIVIRIELKTGSNFEIAQTIRYLVDVDGVVTCIAGRGEAIVVKRSDASDHVESVMLTYARKLQDLLKDSTERIAGPWCSGCPITDCSYRTDQFNHRVNFEKEFRAPISGWIAAIDDAIKKTIGLLEELTQAETGGVASL